MLKLLSSFLLVVAIAVLFTVLRNRKPGNGVTGKAADNCTRAADEDADF